MASESSPKRPLVLLILDGFGYSEHSEHNAIAAANTRFGTRSGPIARNP